MFKKANFYMKRKEYDAAAKVYKEIANTAPYNALKSQAEFNYKICLKKMNVSEPEVKYNSGISLDKAIVFVAGESIKKPGYQYRVDRYASAFRQVGESVVEITLDEAYENCPLLESAKVVFVWRAAWSEKLKKIVSVVRNNGGKLVYDIDDLMFRPELAVPEYIDAIRYDKKDPSRVASHYQNIQRAMSKFDYFTCPTDELAWQMRRSNRSKPTFVLPNGFSEQTYLDSRFAARSNKVDDEVLRIGYAGGSRTHQADFKMCSLPVAKILRSFEKAKLVLFKKNGKRQLDIEEFPEYKGLEEKIEWREMVDHSQLPFEMARFDINLAPLQYGNPFCEAKSELKYFESGIVEVPTVASPTGPFEKSIKHGKNGMLAYDEKDWESCLLQLLKSEKLRKELACNAHISSLWSFGPLRRAELAYSFIKYNDGGRDSARSFHYSIHENSFLTPEITIQEHHVVYEKKPSKRSSVTVIIPLFNYEEYVIDALESVKKQTLDNIDLVVVDDCSTDDSQSQVYDWMLRNSDRFNRAVLVSHKENSGLGASRNTAFYIADSVYIMALDADNILKPSCCEKLLEEARVNALSFCYPTIKRFGNSQGLMGDRTFSPALFIPGNGIDAMALVSKEAWALVGGYTTHRMGWQDYDFWCRLVDRGLVGKHFPEVLAEYRVHGNSMLHTSTDKDSNKIKLIDWMEGEHPWLSSTQPVRNGHHVS